MRTLNVDLGDRSYPIYIGEGLLDDLADGTAADARRLEARAAIQNGRGNGALRKLGAVQEGILRKSFLRNGKYHDQTLWAILDEDWYRSKAVWGAKAS